MTFDEALAEDRKRRARALRETLDIAHTRPLEIARELVANAAEAYTQDPAVQSRLRHEWRERDMALPWTPQRGRGTFATAAIARATAANWPARLR